MQVAFSEVQLGILVRASTKGRIFRAKWQETQVAVKVRVCIGANSFSAQGDVQSKVRAWLSARKRLASVADNGMQQLLEEAARLELGAAGH